jgi:hypothetical protein
MAEMSSVGPISLSGQIVLKTRTSWAFQHLRSAALFAGEAARLDVGGTFPAPVNIDTRYVAASTAAIVEAACALEATINELRSDLDEPSEQAVGRAAAVAPVLRRLWHTVDRGPILEKMQWLLLLSGCEAFDQGREPFQPVADVVFLRNELVHFKVEWSDDAAASARIESRLFYRFPCSSWAAPSQLYFPYRCIGAGAAQWAYESVRDLLPAFFARLGTRWRLEKLRPQLDAAFILGRS